MTSYTGVCVYRHPTTGQVTDVQVKDPGGNELPLPLSDYLARGVQPPYVTLRDCSEALKQD